MINAYTADDVRRTADPFDVPALASAAPLIHQPLATTRPAMTRTAVRRHLELLPEFDRHLLCLYFLEGRTQAEIAKGLQISDQQALQLLGTAIRRLYRDMLTARLQQSTSRGSVRRSPLGEGAA